MRSPTMMVGTACVDVVVGVGWVSVEMVVVRSCERVCHALFLSSCGLSLWGMYAATILRGDSAVLRVTVRNLPLIGLRSVMLGVMYGAVMMELKNG